jgi:hypothetical protein
MLDWRLLLSDCQAEYSPFSHRSALTFLDRNGLTENHQGGKTGGVTVRMKFLFCVLIFAAEKFRGIAQLVERLVRNDRLTNTLIFSQVLSPDFSEVKPRRDIV